jgi:Acetyltransferase (GNAT) domain
MRLVATGAAAREPWERAAAMDAATVASQTPAWMDAVCAVSHARDATRLYEAPDGRRLVLPLARRARGVEHSMPVGWGMGGLLAVEGTVREDDVRGVVADLRRRSVLELTIRPRPGEDERWSAAVPARLPRTDRMLHVVDLASGFPDLWAHAFSSNVRRNCRRAEKAGLTVACDDTGRLVPEFDRLYRLSVSRWAAEQHEPAALSHWRARHRDPVAKFHAVAERLGPRCRVWVASRDGQPAAAIIVLTHGTSATYWRGAMDKEVAVGTGANELLHRLAIERACAEGALTYDMGESAPGSGLARFKRGFGGREVHVRTYRFERLPVSRMREAGRQAAKRAIGFRDR